MEVTDERGAVGSKTIIITVTEPACTAPVVAPGGAGLAVSGSFFPARMKNGTPAHRQLSTSSLRAAYVSVRESGLTLFSCR